MNHNQNFIAQSAGESSIHSNWHFGLFKFVDMKEIFKDIIELDSKYQISNYGRVKRKMRKIITHSNKTFTIRERISNEQDNGKGYKQLYVQINNQRTLFYIHRLVAKYFVKNDHNKLCINHIDGDKSNNHYTNLEWCTHKENMIHAKNNGLMPRGEDSSSSKLKEVDIIKILRLYAINPNFNKSQVARKFNVRDTTIHKIIKRQRWAHLKI